MVPIEVTKTIAAPVGAVFDTVAHTENFARVIPEIVKVEYVTEKRSGVGTRFQETRRMGKRLATAEFEITEYAENERIRLVTDAGGTVWDTVFTTKPAPGGGAELTMTMDAKPHKLLAKVFNPLLKGMLRKAVEKDMDAVKAYCEKGSA
jgi:carbon monoxide dehydrogenase subunit G